MWKQSFICVLFLMSYNWTHNPCIPAFWWDWDRNRSAVKFFQINRPDVGYKQISVVLISLSALSTNFSLFKWIISTSILQYCRYCAVWFAAVVGWSWLCWRIRHSAALLRSPASQPPWLLLSLSQHVTRWGPWDGSEWIDQFTVICLQEKPFGLVACVI